MKKYLYVLAILLFTSPSHAVIRYVSSTGSSGWSTCSSAVGSYCSLDTAMTNAAAGDVVRLVAGSYSKAGTGNRLVPAWNPSNSGSSGSPITFEAYPTGASVSLTISSSSGPVIGTEGTDSYITYRGLKVVEGSNYLYDSGVVSFRGGGHNIFEDGEIQGVYRADLDNHDGVRIETEDYTTVRNSYIHGMRGQGWNSCGVKLYHDNHITVEYCTFYNNTCGVWDKQGNNTYNTYRYNLFNMNGIHFKVYTNSTYPTSSYHDVYENIFLAIDGSEPSQDHQAIYVGGYGNVSNIDVYNNTIYNSENTLGTGAVGFIAIGPNCRFWNNMIMNVDNRIFVVQSGDVNSDLSYMDYNQYYNSNTSCPFRIYETACYTLSTWRSTYNKDLYSNTDNPVFDNPGGTNDHDYQRSTYPSDGRGGIYESVIGAWLSDTNPVHIGQDLSESDTTPPSVYNAVVNSTGSALTLTLSEECTGNDGFTLDASGGTANISYSSGTGTSRVYAIDRTILSGETLALDYSSSEGNVTDLSTNEMVTFSGGSVSNGSEQVGVNPPQRLRFGSITPKFGTKQWIFE